MIQTASLLVDEQKLLQTHAILIENCLPECRYACLCAQKHDTVTWPSVRTKIIPLPGYILRPLKRQVAVLQRDQPQTVVHRHTDLQHPPRNIDDEWDWRLT